MGMAFSRYLRTVSREIPNAFATCRWERPSTNTLCRTTCTWSILSILLADPKLRASATANQTLKWITFRAANGSLSERRVQVARHRMTSDEYQQEFDKLTGQGFRLVHVSGYNYAGKIQFAAIW